MKFQACLHVVIWIVIYSKNINTAYLKINFNQANILHDRTISFVLSVNVVHYHKFALSGTSSMKLLAQI